MLKLYLTPTLTDPTVVLYFEVIQFVARLMNLYVLFRCDLRRLCFLSYSVEKVRLQCLTSEWSFADSFLPNDRVYPVHPLKEAILLRAALRGLDAFV